EKALSEGLPSGGTVLSDPGHLDSFERHFWAGPESIVAIRNGHENKTALVEVQSDSGKILSEKPTGILADLSARRLPDGRFALAEVFYHPLGEGGIDTTDLVIFDPATLKHERLTKGQHIYSADLSPDGRTFAATRRNGMWIELILLDSDGSNIRTIISKPGIYFDSPRWSPDGSRIAAVIKSGRNADIVIIDPADGHMELLFKSDATEDNEPEFSPDGKWLVFSSDRNGTWNIHAWDLDGKRLYRLTSVFAVAGDPHVSPDGRTVSYSNTVRGVKQVCTMDFNPPAGKEIPVEAADGIMEPDLKRLQPEVVFHDSKGIPLDSYKPFMHVPYFSSDEEGAQAGVFIMGA
ncbi:hypothetical protein EG829_32600, partial [bacterium]|nr:hypothetical protein [bacterium]